MTEESLKFIEIFLLTHPVWDVTATAADETTLAQHFYSHIPCGM